MSDDVFAAAMFPAIILAAMVGFICLVSCTKAYPDCNYTNDQQRKFHAFGGAWVNGRHVWWDYTVQCIDGDY